MPTMNPHWSFPVATLPDNPHRGLPLLAVPPNWKNGITETLAWLTDVMVSENAVEQRRSLRRYPRRAFEYEYLRATTARSTVENFVAGVAKKDCLVPLWHEQYTLPDTENSFGQVVFPEGSLAEREFAEGDIVLIFYGDKHALLEVTDVNLAIDFITLSAGVDVGQWPRGSRIVPVRRAKVLDAISMGNPSDRVGTTRVRFMLQDADERFTPSWGYCSPLWRTKPDRSSQIKLDFDRMDFVLDFNVGVIDVTDPGNRAEISQSMSIKLFGRKKIWAYRSFLYNARGRARRFYVPTFMHDIELAADIPVNGYTFDAKPTGFAEFYGTPQEARRIIGFDFADGRPSIYRNLVGVTALPAPVAPFMTEVERFEVDELLPPMLMREIERINFVVPSRFDQDTIEIFHPVSDARVATSAVVFKSSVVDGMPPIECWTTSLTYPVHAMDEIQVNMGIKGGALFNTLFVEELQTNVTLVESTLEQTLFIDTVTPAPEELQTNAALVESTLEQTFFLETVTPAPEELQTNAEMKDSAIRVALITYTVPPESLTTNFTFIGGTLA